MKVSKELVESTLAKILEIFSSVPQDYLYYKLFGEFPKKFFIKIEKNNVPVILSNIEDLLSSSDTKYINFQKSIKYIQKSNKFIIVELIGSYGIKNKYLIVGENVLFICSITDNEIWLELFSDSIFNVKKILPYLSGYTYNKDKTYEYITFNGRNYETKILELSTNQDVSLDNYNNDIPYDKYLNFCDSDTTGLALLYGKPGCGKTTFIKKLICNSNKKFYLMDSNILSAITYSNFISFMINIPRGSIIILEDCEKLLKSRDNEYNPIIGTLLNMTDGLIGDALQIKFICTFNTNLSNIDPAVLRKGRLRIKYEFKELEMSKAEKIAKKLGISINSSISLADLYNENKVDYSVKPKTKLGF